MEKLRILLLPFSWLYGFILFVRNKFYDWGFLKSYSIPKKSICVGNLSVGGTGKTPHVDLILNHFSAQKVKVAALSRGYGRTTKGLLEVKTSSTAEEVGDEPLFYKLKYGNNVPVVVAEARVEGVNYIHNRYPDNELIVLDDAFQHRAVKAGFNIILTEYNRPFSKDFVLPAGNLREWKIGKNRADVIIVSKCPEGINEQDKKRLSSSLNFPENKIFFSRIVYDELKEFNGAKPEEVKHVLLVTGIGNPTPLLKHLQKNYSVTHLNFRDHHAFTEADIAKIQEKFDSFASRDKIIVTTEKDYMRFKVFDSVTSKQNQWFYQPITTKIDKQNKLNLLLDGYAKKD